MAFHKWSVEEVQKQQAYVESINPYTPGRDFHHKTEIYLQYCEMIAWHFMRSGFPYTAEGIEAKVKAIRRESQYGTNKTV